MGGSEKIPLGYEKSTTGLPRQNRVPHGYLTSKNVVYATRGVTTVVSATYGFTDLPHGYLTPSSTTSPLPDPFIYHSPTNIFFRYIMGSKVVQMVLVPFVTNREGRECGLGGKEGRRKQGFKCEKTEAGVEQPIATPAWPLYGPRPTLSNRCILRAERAKRSGFRRRGVALCTGRCTWVGFAGAETPARTRTLRLAIANCMRDKIHVVNSWQSSRTRSVLMHFQSHTEACRDHVGHE